MKHSFLFLLFALVTISVFSQGEFVIEKYNGTQDVFFKSKGCTPDDGVIVFYTEISNLKFSMPDTPKRLRNISAFDNEKNCYVLCIQPTDKEIGGISKYSIDITNEGYIPATLEIKDVRVGETQYFTINSKNDSVKVENEKLKSKQAELEKMLEEKNHLQQTNAVELNFTFKDTSKQNTSSVELYLDNQLIGEINFNKGLDFKYEDTKPGVHKLRVWTKDLFNIKVKWERIINTTVQTDFLFEYSKIKTGFGYDSKFELIK